jgi:hypothetical protein
LAVLMGLVVACFALLPRAHAVVTDPNDYFPNQTTAVGQGVLLNLTSGSNNTANGALALFSNTTDSVNVANGFAALAIKTTGSVNTGKVHIRN